MPHLTLNDASDRVDTIGGTLDPEWNLQDFGDAVGYCAHHINTPLTVSVVLYFEAVSPYLDLLALRYWCGDVDIDGR